MMKIAQFLFGLLIVIRDRYKQLKRHSPVRLYLGTPGWGWLMFGIGWKTLWFLGFSIKEHGNDQSN